MDAGSHRVQHIFAGQIERRGDFCASDFFHMPLPPHQFRTGQPQLHARKSMDRVVNTAMAGMKTTEHLAVGRIHNRVAAQRGDISPPKIYPFTYRLEPGQVGNALAPGLLLQVSILHRQKFPADRPRHSYIEQSAQQALLPLFRRWNLHSRIFRLFFQQFTNQIVPSLRLCHFARSRITAFSGHISMQFPQRMQCSCRISAGKSVKSIQLCGQTALQTRQPLQASVIK